MDDRENGETLRNHDEVDDVREPGERRLAPVIESDRKREREA